MEVGFLQETKSILKSLVLSCPNGMTIDRINRDYREMVGSWIPFNKLGFASLELFLKSMPDTLVVSGHGREARIGFVSNEKLKHINDMVSRQKNTTRERKVAVLNATSQISRVQNISPLHTNNFHDIQTSPASISCSFNRNNVMNTELSNNNNPLFISANNQRLKEADLNRVNRAPCENVPKSSTVPTNNTYYKKKTAPVYFKKGNKNEIFYELDNNKNLIDKQSHPTNILNKGILNSRLNEPNRIKNILVQGEKSLSILSEPHSNNLQIPCNESGSSKNISKQNNIVIGNSKNTLDEKVEDKQNASKSVSEVRRYPHRCKVINRVETEQKVSLKNESSTRIPNPFELPSSVSKNNMFNNFEKQIYTDPFSNIDTNDDIDEAVPEFAANNLVFRVDVPENAVAFGRKIPNCELPKHLTKGSVIGVFISEIHSPFKFWFHIHKDNHELDILMNRMECFYRRLSYNDLVIPESCFMSGQVCAALYNDMWHRAEILTNVCNNRVKVHFVDYGTVSEIEIDNVKYLPTIFANTPMQAIRGSLSHIKPISTLWSKRAVREFLSMVSDVLLYAQIIEIDEKERNVYMVLCDSNKDEPVQINKQLVDSGFAKLDANWDENKISKNGYRKRHPREIFPTFEMLETGEYPSLFELEQLLAKGIDYEKMTEKIILFNLNSNMCDELVLQGDCPTHSNTMSFNLLDTNPFKSDIISEIVSLRIFGD